MWQRMLGSALPDGLDLSKCEAYSFFLLSGQSINMTTNHKIKYFVILRGISVGSNILGIYGSVVDVEKNEAGNTGLYNGSFQGYSYPITLTQAGITVVSDTSYIVSNIIENNNAQHIALCFY